MNECAQRDIQTTLPHESRRVNDNKATESNAFYLHSAHYLHTTRGRLVAWLSFAWWDSNENVAMWGAPCAVLIYL